MKRPTLTILMLTAAVLAGCRGDQAAARKDPPAAAPTASASVSPQLLALLPARNEVPGWAFSRAPRSFTAENLWELIDGAADGFVTYGVQEMVIADCTQAGTGYQAVIEIYQMKDPLNAFGKYSEERNPDYQFLNVGNEGYSGGTSVNFWTGQYYVKITTFEEKDQIKQEIVKLAQSVAAKVTTPGTAPRELSYFPTENQLPHATLYIPKDVLAQSYFTNGFQARYKAGQAEYKLILIGMESAAAAGDALSRYRQFVGKNGKDIRAVTAPGDGGFSGKDSFYGNLVAVRAGTNVVVALGVASEDAGRKQLAGVIRHIK
jgi:hypothetical protein